MQMPGDQLEQLDQHLKSMAKRTDMVWMFADASTSHLTKQDDDVLRDLCLKDRNDELPSPFGLAEYREGFFIWTTVSSDELVADRINELPLSDSAKQLFLKLFGDYFPKECVTIGIRFDADGLEHEGIPTHEW